MSKNSISVPLWFVVVLVVMVLPMAFYPRLLEVAMMESVVDVNLDILRFLVYVMPVYVIASQIFSCKVYTTFCKVKIFLLLFNVVVNIRKHPACSALHPHAFIFRINISRAVKTV